MLPFFQYHYILKAFLFHIYCIEKSHVYFISEVKVDVDLDLEI